MGGITSDILTWALGVYLDGVGGFLLYRLRLRGEAAPNLDYACIRFDGVPREEDDGKATGDCHSSCSRLKSEKTCLLLSVGWVPRY